MLLKFISWIVWLFTCLSRGKNSAYKMAYRKLVTAQGNAMACVKAAAELAGVKVPALPHTVSAALRILETGMANIKRRIRLATGRLRDLDVEIVAAFNLRNQYISVDDALAETKRLAKERYDVEAEQAIGSVTSYAEAETIRGLHSREHIRENSSVVNEVNERYRETHVQMVNKITSENVIAGYAVKERERHMLNNPELFEREYSGPPEKMFYPMPDVLSLSPHELPPLSEAPPIQKPDSISVEAVKDSSGESKNPSSPEEATPIYGADKTIDDEAHCRAQDQANKANTGSTQTEISDFPQCCPRSLPASYSLSSWYLGITPLFGILAFIAAGFADFITLKNINANVYRIIEPIYTYGNVRITEAWILALAVFAIVYALKLLIAKDVKSFLQQNEMVSKSKSKIMTAVFFLIIVQLVLTGFLNAVRTEERAKKNEAHTVEHVIGKTKNKDTDVFVRNVTRVALSLNGILVLLLSAIIGVYVGLCHEARKASAKLLALQTEHNKLCSELEGLKHSEQSFRQQIYKALYYAYQALYYENYTSYDTSLSEVSWKKPSEKAKPHHFNGQHKPENEIHTTSNNN